MGFNGARTSIGHAAPSLWYKMVNVKIAHRGTSPGLPKRCGYMKNGRHNSSRKLRAESSQPSPATAQPLPKEVPTPLVYPQEKRELAYLSGAFSYPSGGLMLK
ncbi:hypothetical protein AVEN_213493-1 [Araneus ventricosus]|uniref:Uncharacterized protein n=1 Tax=Araneus ventricosus TaxID=182803 RepID=A0A4Y2PSM1_ARAVE|nr:hypothetical protein AVEN_213493-1 [Araneus ventricosus]